jgi:nitrogen fixation protein NifU and related proteins
MFSPAVLDHFEHPRNAGALAGATAQVEVTNPVCGDILQLAAIMERDRFRQVRFLCRGCTTSIACASLLTEKLQGRSMHELQSITAESLSEDLGNLPTATFHGAQLAIDALQALLKRVESR